MRSPGSYWCQLISAGCLLGVLFVSAASAQTGTRAGKSQSGDADLAAVKQAADNYSKAFEAGDAGALAQLFTEEGEFVDGSDNLLHGRKAIQEAFTKYFKDNPRSKLVVDMDVVRRLSGTVLVEEGRYSFEPLAKDAKAASSRSKYTLVHVKENGTWRIASVRTERETQGAHHERLKDLEWLIGQWRDEGVDQVVETEWKWSADGNYLLGDFNITSKGKLVMKGTQRLGWDPLKKCIRSWVFDSEGGFGEGHWTKSSTDEWLVRSSGTSSEGEPVSHTSIYQRKSGQQLQVTFRDRVEGDDVLPDVTVTIVRPAPAPKSN